MGHLTFELICKIADGEIEISSLGSQKEHVESCRSCQNEIEIQKSIKKVFHDSKLIKPSANFNRRVLEVIAPTKSKKWYNNLIQNLGNIIAMALVLGFLGYVYSITNFSSSYNDQSSDVEQISNVLKSIQDINHQFVYYFTHQLPIPQNNASNAHIAIFVILAILSLGLIDRIILYFLQKSHI